MPELLLEVGTEELPATFVRKAYTDLLGLVGEGLKANGLWVGEGVASGTPRRLIVSFSEVKERQEDSTKEQRGPALRAAYGEDGTPTKALLGFCRSQGIEPSELRKDDQYVWVTKRIAGRPASEILSEILPEAIRKLSFEKSMRWGTSRMRFARPLRWILASLDGAVVDFDIEGVRAGLTSRGHRFYAPGEFKATTLRELAEGLRKRKVEPDASNRRAAILEQAAASAAGIPDLPEALVEENVFLTEWPDAVAGEFKPEFRALPDAVLVTAMAKHEKMFPVRDGDGRLTNRFVFIRNSGEESTVRQGAEWVLNARFNDAKFFFDEDRKHDLEGFLEKTAGILFQEKLGTVRQRAERLARLCVEIARATGADEQETEYARLAGRFSKADLATGLVSELASLQGIIGGEYARREGMAEPVCWAISTQYDPSKNEGAGDEKARTALRLVVADQIDKLAGYLGQGLTPSGSSDPFGLRRSATILIETAWTWPGPLPAYHGLLDQALEGYEAQGVALSRESAQQALRDLFDGRYNALAADVRYDVLEAAKRDPADPAITDPKGVRFRIAVLRRLAEDTALVQTATRPLNIVAAARRKGVEFGVSDPLGRLEHSALESGEGLELFQLLASQEAPMAEAVSREDLDEAERLVRNLMDPINRFFDTTMVMADQPDVRYARLTLMQAASLQLLQAGDFSKLVTE
ncbi:MAG TPA: glycine--tRNA ligase subunit beta [Fimbriimonas sp.]